MPKMKSHSGAAKRFKPTGSGGFKRRQAFKNHILTKKSPKTIRNLRGNDMVDEKDVPAIKRMLPYA